MIQVADLTFEPYISEVNIFKAVKNIAEEIMLGNKDETPLFLGILNGSFMFCSDLLKQYDQDCQISFIKLASYENTQSTGVVKELIGLNEDLTNRTVIILEDIVDTGNTLEEIVKLVNKHPIKDLKVASLFLKPSVYNKSIPIDYVGFEIPNEFILGYGMDYNGLGRNLSGVYKLKQ